jgi:curved DNA-binding protein CbpA
MGTLYDLLGALPSDDAEGLRTAFRKAAKATHPDMNPDNPDAALRFRELVRAYDILTDVEQRATYDHLLAIALQPEATPATHNYEAIRKFASSTMAATIISAVLVGGYAVFGVFSKPPGATEMIVDRTAEWAKRVGALQPDMPPDQPRAQSEKEVTTVGLAAAAVAAPAANEARAAPIGRFEPVPAFDTYNLGIQYYPRFAAAYFDRGVMMYRIGDFDRPFGNAAPSKRPADPKRTKNAASSNTATANATPARRQPMLIVPPEPPVPVRRAPITAALTPGG